MNIFCKLLSSPPQEISNFAEQAISNLIRADSSVIGNEFFYRVDIFEVLGVLKLNEIESFEARLGSSNTRKSPTNTISFEDREGRMVVDFHWTDQNTNEFIRNFWFTKMLSLLNRVILKRSHE